MTSSKSDSEGEGFFEQPEGRERRGFVRIEDSLPFLYRILKPEEWGEKDPSAWFRNVWNQYPSLDTLSLSPWEPDSKESIQVPLLMELHRKLDLLADLLQERNPASLQRPREQKISLSASGIRVILPESCRLGDRAALYLVLRELPPVNLFVTGEILRIQEVPEKEGYETGIHFIDLGFEDQDRLIKYIFRKLRSELREGRHTPASTPSY
jgi:hypothetical protein